jgi:hypothetical protein
MVVLRWDGHVTATLDLRLEASSPALLTAPSQHCVNHHGLLTMCGIEYKMQGKERTHCALAVVCKHLAVLVVLSFSAPSRQCPFLLAKASLLMPLSHDAYCYSTLECADVLGTDHKHYKFVTSPDQDLPSGLVVTWQR